MRENEELCEWLDSHYISYSMRHDVVLIHGFGKCLIQNDYDHIFKKDYDGNVLFKCIEDYSFLRNDSIKYVIFKFGDRWFYVDIDDEQSEFHVLRGVGDKPVFSKARDFYYLGIHSGYELLNGSGLLPDWCAKASFLGYKGIGVADKNTFASSLDLQRSASAAGLAYTFGYGLSVSMGGANVDVILYAKNQEGFRNILRLQKTVGVDECEVDVVELMNRARGNSLVFSKWSGLWMRDNDEIVADVANAYEGRVYFQVDVTEYKAERIDAALLTSVKSYFDDYYSDGGYKHGIKPALIPDTYYIDKEEWVTKVILNKVDTGAAHEKSTEQYMKTVDEMYAEFRNVFSDKYGDDVFDVMCQSTVDIAEGADAMYDLTDNYMPEYIMTDEERAKYGTNHNMFLQLLEDGFKKLVPEGSEQLYRDRLNSEVYVLEETDSIDYMLVQWDVINWAHRNGIMTGIGRGSASGSLVLYLLGITIVDPIKYDLIFERFLVPERAGLEYEDVTVVGNQTECGYYEIELENGGVYRVSADSELRVVRNGEEIDLQVSELCPDDDIKFDNRDLLFTLKEIKAEKSNFMYLFD